jgi:hypothetical protein
MQTGRQHGGTGLGEASNTIRPISPHQEQLNIWESIPEGMLTSSARRWATVTLGKMPLELVRDHSLGSLEAARDDVGHSANNIQDFCASRSSREDVIKGIGVMAEVLQVTLPSPEALTFMAEIIAEEVQPYYLPLAIKDTIKKHKWATLPNAAEVIEAAQPYQQNVIVTQNLLRHTVRKLSMAIKIHPERTQA